jgi:hypothetical protein
MDQKTLYFVLTIAGTIISLLLIVLGFFLVRIVNDVRFCVIENGKNKGRIENLQTQQQNDVQRIDEVVELQLSHLAENMTGLTSNVQALSGNVDKLVMALATKGLKNG